MANNNQNAFSYLVLVIVFASFARLSKMWGGKKPHVQIISYEVEMRSNEIKIELIHWIVNCCHYLMESFSVNPDDWITISRNSCPAIKSFASRLYNLFCRGDGAAPLTFTTHIHSFHVFLFSLFTHVSLSHYVTMSDHVDETEKKTSELKDNSGEWQSSWTQPLDDKWWHKPNTVYAEYATRPNKQLHSRIIYVHWAECRRRSTVCYVYTIFRYTNMHHAPCQLSILSAVSNGVASRTATAYPTTAHFYTPKPKDSLTRLMMNIHVQTAWVPWQWFSCFVSFFSLFQFRIDSVSGRWCTHVIGRVDILAWSDE